MSGNAPIGTRGDETAGRSPLARDGRSPARLRPDARLLEAPEFQDLLREASLRPLLRRELEPRFVPAGVEPGEAWEALQAIRRAEGVHSPNIEFAPDGRLVRNWHTEPMSIQRSLRELSDLTRPGALLDAMIRQHAEYGFVLDQYVSEVLANLRFDGFSFDGDSVRRALRRGRGKQASSAVERLVRNYHETMLDIDGYLGEEVTPELLRAIYARLTCGVDEDDLAGARQLAFPLPPLEGPRDQDAVLEIVSATCQGRLTAPWQHPIMVSMLANCRFWRLSPFPSCNNLMGSVVSRLYMRQHGHPAFTLVPKTAVIDEWSQRQAPPAEGGYGFAESFVADWYGTDWTAYYDTLLKLMLAQARRIASTLEGLREEDDRALGMVRDIPGLNRRQREVLQDAVLTPSSEFWVSQLSARFGTVYSTARTDLEALYERGLLTRFVRESTNVYRAVEDLPQALEEALRG